MTPATPAPLVCPYCGRERSVSDVALRRIKCRGCGAQIVKVKVKWSPPYSVSISQTYTISGLDGNATTYTYG